MFPPLRMRHSCHVVECYILVSLPPHFNIAPWPRGCGPILNVGPLDSSQCIFPLVAALILDKYSYNIKMDVTNDYFHDFGDKTGVNNNSTIIIECESSISFLKCLSLPHKGHTLSYWLAQWCAIEAGTSRGTLSCYGTLLAL